MQLIRNQKLAFVPLFCWILCFLPWSIHAQSTESGAGLNVFLDCRQCDLDYIRREITFVNYVRDRQVADVHVLVTRQRTGSGGEEYRLHFFGQQNFANMIDTLLSTTGQSDTEDDRRRAITNALALGLVRYAAKTPIASQLRVLHSGKTAAEQVVDNWNYWVFDLDFEVFSQGEQATNTIRLGGNFSANRVTHAWKLRFSLGTEYSESHFDTDEGKVSSFSRESRLRSLVVKSLSPHWSFGFFGRFNSSTFRNTKWEVFVAPALEYNIFLYAESSRRQIRISWEVGIDRVAYFGETIYGKARETLFEQELSIDVESRQPWGSINAQMEGSHFFHDFSKNRIELDGQIRVRLFKGFSLRLFGAVARIRDQLSLPKGGASAEEILLRQRELETSYEYICEIGFSYTFGSIYSNIVNPRFGR